MSFYCFETRQDRTLAPYPPPEFSQQIEKMSPSEIVDHIINTNIDQLTLAKIEKAIAVPLRQLISPRENRRRRCIPRPQNNFVLYRRNFHAVITRERGNSVAKNFKLISNEAAKHWSAESNEIKQLYELIADCAKKVHDCTYPQYVYQPKHKSSKKGANGTIFREVTVDSCGKKGEKGKDAKDTKALEEARRDKITMTKSFVAATTFLSNLDVSQHSAKFTPIANLNHKGYTSKFSIASDMDNQKRQWRWAHYYNQNNPNNPNIPNNPNNPDSPNSSNSSNIPNPEDIQNDQNNQMDQNDQNIENDKNIQNIQNIQNIHQDNQNNSNERPPSKVNKVNNSNNVNKVPPKVNESPITHPSSPPSPPTMRLLPAIDIPISSNFLATYDRNVWSLVNGFTNI